MTNAHRRATGVRWVGLVALGLGATMAHACGGTSTESDDDGDTPRGGQNSGGTPNRGGEAGAAGRSGASGGGTAGAARASRSGLSRGAVVPHPVEEASEG